MKKVLFSILLFVSATAGFCTTWVITNSGDTFVPATLTIALDDSVRITVATIHQPVEVSLATWNANGNTPLPGGFDLPFGGGLILPAQLGVGIHYYVCSVHADLGMKGTITVENNAGIVGIQQKGNLSVYPNPVITSLTIYAGKDMIGLPYFIADQTGRNHIYGKLVNDATMVDFSQLGSGIYVIQVVGQKRYSIKVVKK
jgi:plastocyanin